MKIIAQSTVSTSPSYLHLGYLSANMFHTERPYQGIGLGVTLLGLLVMARLRFTRVNGKLNLRALPRRRVVSVTGGLLALAGLLVVWFGPSHAKRVPPIYTLVSVGNAMSQIYRQVESDEAAPLTEQAIAELCAKYEDGWYHPLRGRYVSQSPLRIEIRSAGEDGQFDTADDMVQTREPITTSAPASQPSA
jgi:hypothetical protein